MSLIGSNAINLMEAEGAKVQIKGRLEWTKTASGRRRGRYRLWLPDHVRLVEDDAVYLFVVYDPTFRKPIQKTRFVRARDLENVGGRVTWMDATHSTKRGKPANVVHTRVFPDEEVA